MKPAAPQKTAVRLHYVERVLAVDEPLEINDIPGRPEVQVLGVDQREGAGMGNRENVWKLVLVWR